jgi:two-component system, LuxR family, response regulator FixJ
MSRNKTAPPAPAVYLVDDDAGMLNSLAAVMEVASLHARGYPSAEAFLEAYDPRRSGCLVVDVRMPGMSGVDLLERLRAAGSDLPAIVITGHGDVPTAVRSMKLGAVEFLEKPVDPRALVEKVREALERDSAGRAVRETAREARQRMATLTHREREVLRLLVAGFSNKQIAIEMGISVKTVEHHRAHVMSKTAALNVADLVRLKMLADGS